VNSTLTTAGFIDAHSHLRATTLTEQKVAGSKSLEEGLLRMSGMIAVDAEDEAFLACSELVAAGVTGVQFIFHTFGTPDHYMESLSKVLKGVGRTGIRALVILGISDQAVYLPAGLEDNSLLPPWLPPKENLSGEQFAEIYSQVRKLHPHLSFGLGPLSGQWCSTALLGLLGELSQDGARIHTHLLESPLQRNWVRENPLHRLARAKLLGPKTSLAHGVWCDSEDFAMIRDAGAQLVTCPGSNATLGAGKANLDLWRENKIPYGFGLDSAADEVLPLPIALTAMSKEAALSALTVGGMACTDLATDQDVVEWNDLEAGVTTRVAIGGKILFEDGKLHNQSEVDKAKARVSDLMQKNQHQLSERKRVIDSLLPRYVEEVNKCCA